MNKYKAIGFDHTGVIVGISATKFHQKVSNLLNVSVDDFNKTFLNYNTAYNSGKIEKEEFWQKILGELDRTIFFNEMMEIINAPSQTNVEVLNLIK